MGGGRLVGLVWMVTHIHLGSHGPDAREGSGCEFARFEDLTRDLTLAIGVTAMKNIVSHQRGGGLRSRKLPRFMRKLSMKAQLAVLTVDPTVVS